jgi:UDP-2-acetamido-3-amino-2,3-dideoxy-glucuronate N-acetyltransferase
VTAPFVHPSAIVEDGAEVGDGTAVWSHVHLRSGARIGAGCIVGEKTYVAGGVTVGDRVKINAFAYLCTGVTLEDGVMVSAGVIFTNDRYPRATTPDLDALLPSEAGESTLPTVVREGATIGAGAVVGSGLEVGRFAMVGMGSVVTRPVPDFHLVVGNPARPVALVCRCGEPWRRLDGAAPAADGPGGACPACDRRYAVVAGSVVER